MSQRPVNQDSAVEMYVGGLVLDPSTQAPVVILKDESGEHILPIWIGIAEATSIASAIKQVAMARPLTHDLMHDIFDQTGIVVQRVVITELKDQTYFAELAISKGDRVMLIDARPSDAIAIALRESCSIFVSENVLKQAKATFAITHSQPMTSPNPNNSHESGDQSELSDQSDQADQGEGVDVELPPTGEEADFRHIDKSEWEEILSKLDTDDFKYKM